MATGQNGANDLETLNGFFKDVYADQLEDLIPEGVKLQKMIPFSKPNARMGYQYKQPVTLRLEHGVTYGGEAGEAFDLNDAVPAGTKEASVRACEMVLRGRVSFGSISRSINDAASFGRATKHVIKNLMVSSHKKQEQMMFYGQSGLARVDGAVTAAALIPIRAADFAPGIWAGAEGMKLKIYDDKVGTTDRYGAGALSITSVDIKNKTITVDQNVTLVDGDYIFEFGALGNECLGLEAMLDGSVASPFGIPSASYSLWNANKYDNGAAVMTFAKVSDSIADAVSKGLEGKIDFFVNPKSWANLLNEQTAQRRFDSRYDVKKYENGSEGIVFHSQNGIIEVHSSTYVKESLAFGLELDCFERVGSSELTFKVPGSSDDFMIKLEAAHGVEFRTYCDQALFCSALGHNILIYNIIS